MAHKQTRLFFDIESCANPENLALMADPKPAANLKDPAKIAADIAEKKAALIEQAALDPDYGKVLSIGYSRDGVNVKVYAVGDEVEVDEPEPINEKDLIVHFWMRLAECNGCCVGYNILGFDLPYLMARSMYLGVKVPLIPNLAKFRTDPVTDLMAIRYNWDTYKSKGLKQVCKLLRIPNDCPDVDGSKVASLTPDELKAYQASDVKLVIALYNRMNGVYFNHG